MYHCHISLHEDEGMMGQFVVTGTTQTNEPFSQTPSFTVFPNPAKSVIYIKMDDPESEIYYISVLDAAGRVKIMLPQPRVSAGVDISGLTAGTYFLQITEQKTKAISTQKFVKQ